MTLFTISINQDILVDIGSYTLRAGLTSDDEPFYTCPSLIGTLRNERIPPMLKACGRGPFVGKDALKKKDILNLKNPVERGIITDWDSFEILMENVFENLEIPTEECTSITFTEPIKVPFNKREKLVEIMFENFQMKEVRLQNAIVNIFSSQKKKNGLVVCVGGGLTQVVPFIDGKPVQDESTRKLVEFAGQDITEYLQEMLTERGYYFQTHDYIPLINEMKESLGFVSLDFTGDLLNYRRGIIKDKIFELPNGRTIVLGDERFRAAESFFRPSLIDSNNPSIQQTIVDSVSQCPSKDVAKIYSNVIIAGGSTLFEGFAKRLKKEVTDLSKNTWVRITELEERTIMSWTGGITSVKRGLTRQQYKEGGAAYVHKICPTL